MLSGILKTSTRIAISLFVSVLYACSAPPPPFGSVLPVDYACIDSFDKYAYADSDIEKRTWQVSLVEPWQLEADLPMPPKRDSSADVVFTRDFNQDTEIWISRNYPTSLGDASVSEFLVYQTQSKQWKLVSSQIKDASEQVERLYITSFGDLWGSGPGVLSKYDEQTAEFKVAMDFRVFSADSRRFLLDHNDVFWAFLSHKAIYSFDPQSYELNEHTSLTDIEVTDSLTLVEDGSIYFERLDGIHFDIPSNSLLQYFPATDHFVAIDLPNERWPAFNGLLLDKNNHLWLGAVGKRAGTEEWHRLHPDPLKYFWEMESEANYDWATPQVVLESANDLIWFSSHKGVAWVNPKTNEGCWFTMRISQFAEDSRGTVWIISGQQLYKYVMNP